MAGQGELPDVGDEVGPYVIEQILGRGTTTTTYRAHHRAMGRSVALKIYHPMALRLEPGARERARTAAVQAAALEHPGIAGVLNAGQWGEEGMFVASALVEGSSLTDAVAAGEVTGARVADIVAAVAQALDAAHARGVVHREVRPDAIVINRWGHPVLRGFGVTRLSGRTGLATRLELSETLRYTAPELILGQAATPAADVFGLAATAAYCLCGEHPFPDLAPVELIRVRTAGDPPRLTPEGAVSRVVATGMAADPAQRPTSASAFASDLARNLDALAGPVRDAARSFGLSRAGAEAQPALGREPRAATRVDHRREAPAPDAPAPKRRLRPWRRGSGS